MAFVVIGIGDRPKSVKLDEYHIHRSDKSLDSIL